MMVFMIFAVVLFSAVCLTGCGSEQKKVVIGNKGHAEQYILSSMLQQLITAHTDIKAEVLDLSGGTPIVHEAMIAKQIDMYPEYSNSGWLYALQHEPFPGSHDDMVVELKKEYHDKFGFEWFGFYGFDNSYAIAVRKETADELNLRTISDIAAISEGMKFGANPDYYEVAGGYTALSEAYGFKFDTLDIEVGLKYKVLSEGQVDAINAFTTDGSLARFELALLEDDNNFFQVFLATTLIREDTLKKYPELRPVLDKLTGQISAEEMITMNDQVETVGRDPQDVAKEFLESKNLL
jgi:glycine betaine/choline ABC-type transport system substrate-binding protein